MVEKSGSALTGIIVLMGVGSAWRAFSFSIASRSPSAAGVLRALRGPFRLLYPYCKLRGHLAQHLQKFTVRKVAFYAPCKPAFLFHALERFRRPCAHNFAALGRVFAGVSMASASSLVSA